MCAHVCELEHGEPPARIDCIFCCCCCCFYYYLKKTLTYRKGPTFKPANISCYLLPVFFLSVVFKSHTGNVCVNAHVGGGGGGKMGKIK